MRVHPRSSLEEISYGQFFEVEFSDAMKIGVIVIVFHTASGRIF
jgi:hypothetical protein